MRAPLVAATFALASAIALAGLARLHRDPPRCAEGLAAIGARCCGVGQSTRDGRCIGKPDRCAAGLEITERGCVAPRRRVVIAAGASGWSSPDTTIAASGESASTGAFAIDAHEVTWGAWEACTAARSCAALVVATTDDPGQAVFGVTREEARAYCRWAGGRLPRDEEWLRAALGEVETRYPWGDPDAFCLRAAFALDGRCAQGGRGPDTAGAHPWGATPSGIHDLAGNVAEWVESDEPTVRGGSWAEPNATALRPRWRKVVDATARLPWIGFRCAYDLPSGS